MVHVQVGGWVGQPKRAVLVVQQLGAGRVGAELWVTRHEARLREDVATILAWQEKVCGNQLAKADLKPPFGWMG